MLCRWRENGGREMKCNLVFINIFAFENNLHSSGSDLHSFHSGGIQYTEYAQYTEYTEYAEKERITLSTGGKNRWKHIAKAFSDYSSVKVTLFHI